MSSLKRDTVMGMCSVAFLSGVLLVFVVLQGPAIRLQAKLSEYAAGVALHNGVYLERVDGMEKWLECRGDKVYVKRPPASDVEGWCAAWQSAWDMSAQMDSLRGDN